MHPANHTGKQLTDPETVLAGALPDGSKEIGHREPMERKCLSHLCLGKVYTVEMREGRHFFVTPFCDTCVKDIKAKEEAQEQADRRARWLKETTKRWMDAWGGPASGYHKTTLEKLPLPNHSKKALLWTPDEQMGLILTGPSGTGKSRTMYLVLDRLRRERQIIADVQPCIQLRQKIVSAARSRHDSDRQQLITQLSTAPVLYLDDLGQMNNTDAAAEALLEIIELRHRAELPTLATTQFSDEQFIQTFKQRQTGEAIARRLGDSSHIIKFPALQ